MTQKTTRMTNYHYEGLPGTLARPVESLTRQIDAEGFSQAMNYALDFLEISTQYVSCYLFVLLQEVELNLEPSQRPLGAIVRKIDTKRSLSFGDWVNDIFNPLVRIAQKEMPGNPLVQSISSVLFHRGNNRLLGGKNEPSVVRIRNEYKGHSTTLSNEIYKGVVSTLEPHVINMLKAMEPFTEMDFEYSGNHCVIAYRQGHKTDLYPLVFKSPEGYEYVFQSLKDEEISYISSDVNAVTLINDTLNPDFDALLKRTDPAFDISQEINWPEMRKMMREESSRFLDRVYREKKYNRELFVERTALSSVLRNFTESDKTLLPLLGEAGQGKTNQLCFWTEEISASDDGVLIFSSSDFSEYGLPATLRRVFGTSPRKDPERIVREMHERAAQEDRIIYVFFDAINECLHYEENSELIGPVALYESFRNLFIKPEYSRFKVLFTCRNYTWKNLFHKQMGRDEAFMYKPDGGTEVHGFNDAELQEAWRIYQNLYQMSNDFNTLSKVSLVRLKDPLVLKIACTNHVGRTLPDELEKFTSVALFEEMTDIISHSYAGRQQLEILLTMASYMLGEYEAGRPSDRIETAELKRACSDTSSPLHKLSSLIYKNGVRTVACTELLNKPERPILRHVQSPDGHTEIQFIYERYLEFLMAKVFVDKHVTGDSMIPAETYIKALCGKSGNVVFMGTLRNALILDCLRTHDNSTVISLIQDHEGNFEASLLVSELFSILVSENFEETLFSLTRKMLMKGDGLSSELVKEFNSITKLIYANKADENVISRHKELQAALKPEIRLAESAAITVINGMFLSDWYNSSLYRNDPYELLWSLVNNRFLDVCNDACMYIYYLHNKKFTGSHTPVKENITLRIVHRMFDEIKEKGLVKTISNKALRSKSVSFVEAGGRIAVMLMINEMLAGRDKEAARLMDELRGLVSYLTWDYRIIKLIMPFFSTILRKQITFQSAYVNNAIEYQTFWDDTIVPASDGGEGRWCRHDVCELADCFITGRNDGFKSFRKEKDRILKAYYSGDSFSYFVMERLMIVAGISDWENIAPIVRDFFSDRYRSNEWFDYSQMSMLYVLYQLHKKASGYIPELVEIFSREAADWTLRCKGRFKGHNSSKANTTGYYKRNVMNWYCDVYCAHYGDNVAHEGDSTAVPIFYKLIEDGIARRDRTLLMHLLDNVSELVSDNGLIKTALALLFHTMSLLGDSAAVKEIDSAPSDRDDGFFRLGLVQAIGNILSTAKNYFPEEVDEFLKREIVGLDFEGISTYREEVLSYNPSGESLSDLFTHSFGNFVIWSLVNFEPFKAYAVKVVKMSEKTSDSFQWYDYAVREGFRELFRVKL